MAYGAAMDVALEDLLSTVEVVELTGRSRRTIARWVASGRLEPVKQLPGSKGSHLFLRADVEVAAAAPDDEAEAS